MGRLNICQTCRAFFEPDLKVCPHCGTSIVPRMLREHGGVFDRLASARLEMNLLIILANVLLYVVCVVLSGGFRTGGEGNFLRTFGAVDPQVVFELGGANHEGCAGWLGTGRYLAWLAGAGGDAVASCPEVLAASDTMERLEPLVNSGTLEVYFTHLNHSNPALAAEAPARAEIEARGFAVLAENQVLPL